MEKDGVHKNGTSAERGRDAPEVATCLACGGIVDLRSRRTGRNPEDKTWRFPHRRLRPAVLGDDKMEEVTFPHCLLVHAFGVISLVHSTDLGLNVR